MSYEVELSSSANKYLRKLDKKTRNRILNHILILSENPRHPELNIKKLQGEESLYRLRIGDFRVMYSVYDDVLIIFIVKIGPRGDIYKK
ncbi:type II toxin-antitoxin system RelE family toxin [Caldalkalibacillus salinus]|uniref:type II toxin-antitoxin system RelE family toxin n=1 Tax=Caldalkalibacillus salinus TaxID=2803787 RepID=UPI0019248D9C|nr:type II toxin-antitoxin system RelE/ParE family toxin [Caldalkalibacillus salinus]